MHGIDVLIWLITLAVGLPPLVMILASPWGLARTPLLRRILSCLVLACMAPIPIGFNNGHSQGWTEVVPVALVIAFNAKAACRAIIVISLALFVIWTVTMWVRKLNAKWKQQPDTYQGPRCVACGLAIESDATLCPSCGWTQPK